MIKPTRQQWLKFASLLIAAGLFPAIWGIATQVWPEAELLATINELLAKPDDKPAESDPVRPPQVDIPDEKPTVEQPAVDTSDKRVDDLDISRAIQVCSNTGNNIANLATIPPVHDLRSARVEGSNVRVDYSVPPSYWRGSQATQFARGWVFWQEGGQVYGSHFDWFRQGQTVKTLGNLYNSYLTRRPTGQLYFCIIANGKEARTNVRAAR